MLRNLNIKLALTIALVFMILPGCMKKEKAHVFHIAVVNGGESGGSGERKPITISVKIDEKVIVDKQELKDDRPFSVNHKLEPGVHRFSIIESTTGANVTTPVTLDREYWYKAVFYHEGSGMGVFHSKMQPEPWGYEWEKEKDKTGNSNSEEAGWMNDGKLEEKLDKKMDDLKKEPASKQEPPAKK